MIIIYNIEGGTISAYKDMKAASEESGVKISLLRGIGEGKVIKTGGMIIGKVKVKKSNRGGYRDRKEEKVDFRL